MYNKRTGGEHIRSSFNIFFILIGTGIISFSLKVFLLPNHIIDGGVTGISMIIAHVSHVPFSLLLFVLNIPFWIFGIKNQGKGFIFYCFFSIFIISSLTALWKPNFIITNNLLLASVFGGILIGVGTGLVIRFGGATDGIEIMSIAIDRHTIFSVGQIAMFFNAFILTGAGFIFGWNHALYSLIEYYIAVKMIDLTIEGFDESKSIWIITEHTDELSSAIQTELNRGVTHFFAEGGYSRESRKVLFCVISRLEETRLRRLVERIDPYAFMTISTVHDVKGGRFLKHEGE